MVCVKQEGIPHLSPKLVCVCSPVTMVGNRDMCSSVGSNQPLFQCHSSHSSQDLSCGNRSVFTVCCSPVGLSTITTTEDVWTCWLPWQRGLGKGCCCVDGVHRRRVSKIIIINGPTGCVCLRTGLYVLFA